MNLCLLLRMDVMRRRQAEESAARFRGTQAHSFAEVYLMVNRDVLATFPCRVRRRGQIVAAAPSQPPNPRLRSFDRCRSLSYYRRTGDTSPVHVS
jgi:hypothetical protein